MALHNPIAAAHQAGRHHQPASGVAAAHRDGRIEVQSVESGFLHFRRYGVEVDAPRRRVQARRVLVGGQLDQIGALKAGQGAVAGHHHFVAGGKTPQRGLLAEELADAEALAVA